MKKLDLLSEISNLVKMNLKFHNLNREAEQEWGLSLVQYYFLGTLRDLPGTSPQNFARSVGLHPSTLTQTMKRLLKKKLIFLEEDPKDSRKRLLGLTATGNKVLKNFEKLAAEEWKPERENRDSL